MIKYVAMIALSGTLAFAGPAMAADDRDDNDSEVTSKDNDGAQKIRCRRMIVTGSLIKKRVCKTNAEWAEAAEAGKRDAGLLIDAANQGGTNGK